MTQDLDSITEMLKNSFGETQNMLAKAQKPKESFTFNINFKPPVKPVEPVEPEKPKDLR